MATTRNLCRVRVLRLLWLLARVWRECLPLFMMSSSLFRVHLYVTVARGSSFFPTTLFNFSSLERSAFVTLSPNHATAQHSTLVTTNWWNSRRSFLQMSGLLSKYVLRCWAAGCFRDTSQQSPSPAIYTPPNHGRGPPSNAQAEQRYITWQKQTWTSIKNNKTLVSAHVQVEMRSRKLKSYLHYELDLLSQDTTANKIK